MLTYIATIDPEPGFPFVRFFGGCIHGNVRDFELDRFQNELDKFQKELDKFLKELDNFLNELDKILKRVQPFCQTI